MRHRSTLSIQQNCKTSKNEVKELELNFQKLKTELEDIKQYLNEFRKAKSAQNSSPAVEPESVQEEGPQDENYDSDFEWNLDDDNDWMGNDESERENVEEEHPASLTQKRPKRFDGSGRQASIHEPDMIAIDEPAQPSSARKVEEKPQTSTPKGGKSFSDKLKVPVTKSKTTQKRSKYEESSDSSEEEIDEESSQKRPRVDYKDDPDYGDNSRLEACRKKLMKMKKETPNKNETK